GRTIVWALRYKIGDMHGVDVNGTYIDAARHYAKIKGVPAMFHQSDGKNLPFDDETFDAILTFDVFEHVADIAQSLRECRRCLKPGGKLCAVFPGFYHPVGAHLTSVTQIPCIQYFFSGEDIIEAYNQIVKERGDKASWYARPEPGLRSWEKGHNVNGLTKQKFFKLVQQCGFRVYSQNHIPLFSTGRLQSRYPSLRIAGKILAPLARIPYLDEIFNHRIVAMLEKV
ncbi:MAG: hypothetical protein A3D92_20035, partial [Bacteroidetes bacterium RIFCSPHIGHO2_02_FULL_44_7]